MDENLRNTIIIGIFLLFLTPLYESLWSIYTKENPILILYTVISVVLSYFSILGILKGFKLLNIWWDKRKKEKELEKWRDFIIKDMRKKGIHMVKLNKLAKYYNRKIMGSRNENESIKIFNKPTEFTKNLFRYLQKEGILIGYQKLGIVILREKFKCTECNSELELKDTWIETEIKCKECGKDYRIDEDGIFYDASVGKPHDANMPQPLLLTADLEQYL